MGISGVILGSRIDWPHYSNDGAILWVLLWIRIVYFVKQVLKYLAHIQLCTFHNQYFTWNICYDFDINNVILLHTFISSKAQGLLPHTDVSDLGGKFCRDVYDWLMTFLKMLVIGYLDIYLHFENITLYFTKFHLKKTVI